MKTRTEIISTACFPLFEPLIESVVQQAAASAAGLKVACCGVYEIGPTIAHGGVGLDAPQLPLDDVILGVGFYMGGLKADSLPVFRVSVGWFRTWALDRQAGFSILEFDASCRPSEPEYARSWVKQILPALRHSTSVAIERGRPPSRAKHWLQRVLGKVPPAQIMPLPSGCLNRFPDIATFKQTYDLPRGDRSPAVLVD